VKRQPIRLGVIGAGAAFRKLHWPVLQTMGDEIRVEAVVNRRRETAEAVAALAGGARVHDEYRALLQDPAIDAVLVAVPIDLSGGVLIDAVLSEKHVLAEKPLAATPQQGVEVLRACSESAAVIAVGENVRYRKDLEKARELLGAGEIGEVFAFQMHVYFDLDAETRQVWTGRQWRRDAHFPGGFVLDAGVHPVAYLRDLLGDVCEVDARLLNRHPVVGGYDTLLMQLKLASGAVGQLFACYTAKVTNEVPLEWTLFGSKGSLRLHRDRLLLWRGNGGPETTFSFDSDDRGYGAQWRNFCRAIRGEEPVLSTPEKAYDDLLVIDAAMRSAQCCRRVVLGNEIALAVPL
jgi:predicted dehydrogenase